MTASGWLRVPPEAQVEKRTTWTIAMSVNQRVLGAAIILLNRPCRSLSQVSAGEWMDLRNHLQRLHRALDAVLHPDGYDHAFSPGTSRQVALLVAPRYRSARTWRGERFEDPAWGRPLPVEERTIPSDALGELRDAVRDRLPSVA